MHPCLARTLESPANSGEFWKDSMNTPPPPTLALHSAVNCWQAGRVREQHHAKKGDLCASMGNGTQFMPVGAHGGSQNYLHSTRHATTTLQVFPTASGSILEVPACH